jgi:hypothetical protein
MLRAAAISVLILLWAGAAMSAGGTSDDLTDHGLKEGREVSGGEFVSAGPKGWKVKNAGDSLRYRMFPGGGTSSQGTIELSFAVGDREDHFESVLTLYSADSQPLLAFFFVRSFNVRGVDESILWVRKEPSGEDLSFGKYVSLGKEYQPGEPVRVALSWDLGRPEANAIYANGKRAVMCDYGRPPRVLGPALNQEYATLFASAAFLRAGSDVRNRNPLRSLLTGVAVHDRPLTAGDPGAAARIASVSDDTFRVAGISRKLVAGDKVNVTLLAAPGGKASFDMGNVKAIPMEEVPPTAGAPGVPAIDNGTYQGSYTMLPGDDFADGQVAGHFVSLDNVAAEPVLSASKWTIDTKPVVVFSIDKKDLPADSFSKARIKLIAKDANGNPVKGRHLKLTLATTDEYTGTVGAGDFGKDVGATVETRWRGETDSWGEVEFDYTAGFAAKTVILSAKDLDSGGVTVDYLTAFKEAAIDIALTPPVNRAAARRAMQYILKVEASRTELTADGRSRSVIRATLLDPNGTSVAGDPVSFTLSSVNGTLRTIAGTTDSSGTATAEYTAGKKIGIVVVTATATLRNASGNVSITLLSDAPAKVILKARPTTLPADGNSRTDIDVKVTDINDNPNMDTKVEFRVARGGGRMEYADRLTDRFGDAQNRYTAGTTPGIATILATVRSKIPTDAELARARNVLFVPYSPDGDAIRVEKWLKRKGDSFVKGDRLVEYTVGRSRTVLRLIAPFDGKMGEQFVEYWNDAEVGQTLAALTPTGG